MAAIPPTVEELGPLLGDSAALDEPAPEEDIDPGDAEYEAAAVNAVGTRAKASALKDAIEACLRKHGLLRAPESPDLDAALGELDGEVEDDGY